MDGSGLASTMLVYFLLLQLATAAQNFVVPWSTKHFGPDGPWQAVTMTVGGNDSTLVLNGQKTADLAAYPGGEYSSMTLTSAACKNNKTTQCALGGTWNPDEYQVQQQYISQTAPWVDNSTGVNITDASIVVLGLTINQKTVWNATLASADSGTVTYPNGKVGGVPLGYLALGADATKQFFSTSDTQAGNGINAWLFPGQLYDNKDIPSYSYGLHIGSAAFNYPGSLVFGGYNKGRVIGPVTSFSDQNAVQLIDVNIGVETGGSPFNFTSKDKLLSKGQTAVAPNPLSPYISLPRATCDNIASQLPVTFDNNLKYYVWNTDDPNYTKIIQSPAYLGFEFPPSPGTSNNVIIKVPFALLNLTLEAPITDTPTQYFPCVPYEHTPELGRAFLQAAFLGRNWLTKTSWLAQAPGPGVAKNGLGDQNTDIASGATMIEGFNDTSLFADSWKGQLKPLDDPSGGGTGDDGNTGTTTSSGLSTGAKAGIGIGVALGVIALIAALIFFLRRRSAQKKLAAKSNYSAQEVSALPTSYHDTQQKQNPSEVYAHEPNAPPAELPPMNFAPVELPDTPIPHNREPVVPHTSEPVVHN